MLLYTVLYELLDCNTANLLILTQYASAINIYCKLHCTYLILNCLLDYLLFFSHLLVCCRKWLNTSKISCWYESVISYWPKNNLPLCFVSFKIKSYNPNRIVIRQNLAEEIPNFNSNTVEHSACSNYKPCPDQKENWKKKVSMSVVEGGL